MSIFKVFTNEHNDNNHNEKKDNVDKKIVQAVHVDGDICKNHDIHAADKLKNKINDRKLLTK